MQLLPVILIFIIAIVLSYFLIRRYFRKVVQQKALARLEPILFPGGGPQKAKVIGALNELTNERFNDTEILEYFTKIKGLQITSLSQRANFWTKRYLFSPTAIRLNYFEQVKFYELFLNYPSLF